MSTAGDRASESAIAGVVAGMQECLDRLPQRLGHHRVFLSTYQRTTQAVGTAVARGTFEDPGWVERWDVAFAELYLTALEHEIAGRQPVARPWRLAFAASADLHPLLHVLLGMNAHINYDLPQALLAVISDDDFCDPVLVETRRRDHERIDAVLSARVAAEDDQLPGGRRPIDRLLRPLNRLAAKRILTEARQKVWHNTLQLRDSRVSGADSYAARLAELEVLSAAKIADLLQPGHVLLRLALAGFGITLPPPDDSDRLD